MPDTMNQSVDTTQAKDESPNPELSVVLPVYNEEDAVADTVREIIEQLTSQKMTYEIVLVDDGSVDASAARVENIDNPAVRLVQHPYNIGNGAAVKTGIRQARGKYILLMDADGQHLPRDIPRFLELADRYDMVVGARSNPANSAVHRNIANGLYSRFAAYVCNHPIEDLTSGYRLIRAEVAKSFVYLLPNTFSYPSTLTLAVIRAGYSLTYIPIEVNRRIGRSKINLIVDGTRFFMIILRIGVFFAPLRVFLPLSGALFMTGLLWYVYKQFVLDKGFPPISSLLMITAAIIFCIGLISEQISYLRYERK